MNVRKVFLRNLSDEVQGGVSELNPGKFVITNEAKNRVLITTPILKRSIKLGIYILDVSTRPDVVFTRDDYCRADSSGRAIL